MNQVKIGKFISECRKEKQITQEQLAVQLGVTSKSISKWETGLTFEECSNAYDFYFNLYKVKHM